MTHLRKGKRVDTPAGPGTVEKKLKNDKYVVKLDGKRGEFSHISFHSKLLKAKLDR